MRKTLSSILRNPNAGSVERKLSLIVRSSFLVFVLAGASCASESTAQGFAQCTHNRVIEVLNAS